MQLRLLQDRSAGEEKSLGTRRVAPAAAVSILLHVLLVLAVASALQAPTLIERFFARERPAEHVNYVAVPPVPATMGGSTVATPKTSLPVPVAAPPLVAPKEVPSTIPAPSPSATPAPVPGTGASGPLAGGTGPTRGVAPTYSDPRVWVKDPDLIYAPKTPEERLDSALAATIMEKADSIAANTYKPNKFERGDWTVERNGKKYGIDQQYIHLGNVSIPTALLALLPLNRAQANPVDLERQRSAAYQRSDIFYHAQTAISEQEFRAAVKAIRERKEREAREKPQKTVIARKGDPHAIVAPGDRPPQ